MEASILFDEDYVNSIKTPKSELIYRLKILLKNINYREWYVKRMDETVDMVIRNLNIQNGRFLDFGCGAGWFIAGISKKTKCDCIGFDIDVESIKFSIARRNYENTEIKFLLSVGETLPFKDSTFDYIGSIDVLEHVEDFDNCLSEITRILKPNGKALFTVPNKLAVYTTGHQNWKSQLRCFFFKLAGEKMDFRKHGDLGFERLFTYSGLKNSLNKLIKCKYTILSPQHKNILIYILNKTKISMLIQPSFVIILEKTI
jgi:ubiquinone/menaquinone biosynthesis C-methylase UbiE